MDIHAKVKSSHVDNDTVAALHEMLVLEAEVCNINRKERIKKNQIVH